MKFTKMHGAGNDYIYIDCLDGTFGGESAAILADTAKIAAVARMLSDRHFGIGADGIILILPSDKANFRMRMFNADGSEGRMCGNATRCIGKYVFDHGYTHHTDLTLETASGVKYLTLFTGDDGTVENVTVDMGEAEFSAPNIPVILPEGAMGNTLDIPVEIAGEKFNITAVSMGNPHGVVFVDEITDSLVHTTGSLLEVDAMWPDRANIEFATVLPDGNINMRVWERGSGETLACGTGACATAVAAMATGRTSLNEVIVHLIGGDLRVRWHRQQNRVYMTGPATTVFQGEIPLPFL